MTARFARVALPLPLAAPYTYRIPETLGDRVHPGARVVVPVRARELIGVALEVDTPPPEAEASPRGQDHLPAGDTCPGEGIV
jgi:primosomal protein N' (replication factor Y)